MGSIIRQTLDLLPPPAILIARDGRVRWFLVPPATDAAASDADYLPRLAHAWAEWLAQHPTYRPDRDDTAQFGWIGTPDWWTPKEVAGRYGLADAATVRMAKRLGRIHPAAIRIIDGRTWVMRAEEAERLWGVADRRGRRSGAP